MGHSVASGAGASKSPPVRFVPLVNTPHCASPVSSRLYLRTQHHGPLEPSQTYPFQCCESSATRFDGPSFPTWNLNNYYPL